MASKIPDIGPLDLLSEARNSLDIAVALLHHMKTLDETARGEVLAEVEDAQEYISAAVKKLKK